MVLMVRPPLPGERDDFGSDDLEARLAVRRAAMPLLIEHGYDATSVDAIASVGGVSRRSFFRLFDGKHQVVSCDHGRYHEKVLAALQHGNGGRTPRRAAVALSEVLRGFGEDLKAARERQALIASHSLLQAEELRWSARYRATISGFLSDNAVTTVEAEYIAGGLVAAAEKTLRDWIDGIIDREPAEAFVAAVSGLAPRGGHDRVVVVESALSAEEIRRRLAP